MSSDSHFATSARTDASDGARVDTLSEIGWAGYDEKVAWLPRDHSLAHRFGAALATSCRGGRLIGRPTPVSRDILSRRATRLIETRPGHGGPSPDVL